MNRRTTSNNRNYRTASRSKSRRRRKNNRSGFIAFLALTFILSAFMGTGVTASKVADTETMYVSRGDTLWDIATECNTKGDDVRDIMDDIMRLNNMKTAELHIGETIIIPIY